MINNINNFFSVKFSLFILIIICAITILLSRNYYVYDLTGGDAPTYFSLASDLKNYFYLPHQESLRIIPIISVIGVSKIFNVGLENAFYIVTYILYFILVIQTFFFFKSFNISNYLSLSLIAILYYLHHSILYTLFNPYQVVDLYGYIYFLLFFELPRKKGVLPLFILSLLAVFTKEYFLVLVLFSFVYHYIYFSYSKTSEV